ncbi:MAG: glycosyltransferase family 2 protein [Planctomycetota bacterium]
MQRVGIVIPTLNDVEALRRQRRLDTADAVVIADASADAAIQAETHDLATSNGWTFVDCPRGRGVQMNCGAQAIDADVLLFLHADTLLPEGWRDCIEPTLQRGEIGAFGFRLATDDRRGRVVEWLVRRRRRPYGDQALFLRRSTFERLGGYRAWPILEDADLVKRAGKYALASLDVTTSARHYERRGWLASTIRNQRCLWAWRLGVSPQRIARWREPLTDLQHQHGLSETSDPSRHPGVEASRPRGTQAPARRSPASEELETLGPLSK